MGPRSRSSASKYRVAPALKKRSRNKLNNSRESVNFRERDICGEEQRMAYRVSDNPRCLESCHLLYRSLMELLRDNNVLDSLTVTAVATRAGISRATFYHHFDCLLDVLAWAVDLETRQAFRGGNYLAENDIAALTELVFRYWTERSDLLEALLRNDCYGLFVDALHEAFGEYFGPVIDRSSLQNDVKPYLLDIYPAVTSSILKTWIMRGRKESVKKLVFISLRNNTYPR